MKATEYFYVEMTSSEARMEFYKRFRECETVQDLEELKAAYNAISLVINHRELTDALVKGIMC